MTAKPIPEDSGSFRVLLVGRTPMDVSAWESRGIDVAQAPPDDGLSRAAGSANLILVELQRALPSALENVWRARDRLARPVVFIAPGATHEQVVELLRRGADDVITEAHSDQLVAARVLSVLRRVGTAPRPAGPEYHWNGLSVNLETQLVTSPHGDSRLSPIEVRVLSILLRSAGQPVSAGHLLFEGWGVTGPGAAQRLRSCIAHLRRKLEADPAVPELLTTVWGVGYRLTAPTSSTGGGALLPESQSGSHARR